MFTRSNSSFLKDSDNVTAASTCESPVPDLGDGLETTLCGTLQMGVTASGTLSSVSEAHHWQFSTEAGLIRIAVESDGDGACPQIVILDSTGTVVEGFEDRNPYRFCPSGMMTTGSFQFHPPGSGTYTIRLYSPETTGAYWLKIE